MHVFRNAPEFVTEDNRIRRSYSPVSFEQLEHKHEALLPSSILNGKTVLDLGSCMGATGHWCLAHEARAYTGVEPQETYASKSAALLSRYHNDRATIVTSSMQAYFASHDEMFDIVIMLGVLHACTDHFSILAEICARAREVVAIEELVPKITVTTPDFSGIQFSETERTNLADHDASLEGRGARISPRGLSFAMREFGFVSDGVIYPKPITDAPDNFNAPQSPGNARYLMRFTKDTTIAQNVSDELVANRLDTVRFWKRPTL